MQKGLARNSHPGTSQRVKKKKKSTAEGSWGKEKSGVNWAIASGPLGEKLERTPKPTRKVKSTFTNLQKGEAQEKLKTKGGGKG